MDHTTSNQAASITDSQPAAGQITQRSVLTLPRLWVLVALVGIFVVLNQIWVAPNDFWWHLRAGQWIAEYRQIPTTDLFSFTQLGAPWTYQSWLAEVAMALVYRLGHLPLTIFLNAAIITVAYGVLLVVCRTAAGGDLRLATLATLAAAFASPNWNVRPQTISILFFAVTLLLLTCQTWRPAVARQGLWRDPVLWLLVPLYLLWANAHGAFVFGLWLMGAYLLARLWIWWRGNEPFPAQLLAVTLASGLATLVTPSGFDMVNYVLEFWRNPVTRLYNLEFMPPTIRTLDGQLLFAFAGLWLALLLLSRRPLPATEAIPLAVFGVLALMSRRNGIWFCFVAAPSVAASMATLAGSLQLRARVAPQRPWLNRAFLILLVVLALLSLPWWRPYLPIHPHYGRYLVPGTQVEAVAAVCQLPEAHRVFHEQGNGSYLIWACPQKPVFIDTRLELYPPEQWSDYQALTGGRYDWQAILDRYQIDTLLLARESQRALVNAASTSPDWKQICQDDQAIIFQHVSR